MWCKHSKQLCFVEKKKKKAHTSSILRLLPTYSAESVARVISAEFAFRTQAKAAALDRIGEPVVNKVCEKGFDLVKANATADEDMPECVKRTVRGALDIVKPEVKQELHEALCSAVRTNAKRYRLLGLI